MLNLFLYAFRKELDLSEDTALRIILFSDRPKKIPAWKRLRIRLQIHGSDLFSAVLEDREPFI